MALDLAAVLALAATCAPDVAPQTLASIARVESGFRPLAIGVNGRPPRALRPRTKALAVETARDLIAAGGNLDLGLGQINVRNLGWLGLSLEAAFDPCANLAASAKVLKAGYQRATGAGAPPQQALRQALSLYNTGHIRRGVDNGYVAKVERAAGLVPAIDVSAPVSATPAATSSPAPPPDPASWDVFARAALASSPFVISPPQGVRP